MYGIEGQLYNQLCKLRDEYGLKGIKAEFEAEGSSFRDLMRLRRLTSKANVGLYLKIGGVEAIRDMKDALEIGVDGLIAPMVESKFGAKKFHDSLLKVYGTHKIHYTVNIETQGAISQLDDILDFSCGKFDNITIGRSDLTSSYFDQELNPDSDFILKILEDIAPKIEKKDLTLTIGGSISSDTIKIINLKFPSLKEFIYKLETRKVILPTSVFFNKKDALQEALIFEELYILSKKEFIDIQISSEILRLTELKRRAQ
jgi:4-hydroxy-2-oxoheptanedioate aldolase